MPYITPKNRESLDNGEVVNNPGDLNYMITKTLIEYLSVNGLSYRTINDIVGALEGAKAEFYRRVAVPYENQKIKENGDVYEGFAPPVEHDGVCDPNAVEDGIYSAMRKQGR